MYFKIMYKNTQYLVIRQDNSKLEIPIYLHQEM